jgi:hypothetical protein
VSGHALFTSTPHVFLLNILDLEESHLEVICQKPLDQPVTISEEVEVVVMAAEEEEVEGLVDVVVVLVTPMSCQGRQLLEHIQYSN